MNDSTSNIPDPNTQYPILDPDAVPLISAHVSIVDPSKKLNDKIDYLIQVIDGMLKK